MLDGLPQEPSALLQWSWSEIEPFYRDLLNRPLSSATVHEFLADWTRLSDLLEEMENRLHLATVLNTADQGAEQRYRAYLEEIQPGAMEGEQKLKEKLLASGVEPAGFDLPLRKMRTEAAIFRQANVPLAAQEQALAIQFNKVVSAQTVEWEGQEVTIPQLRPVYQEADRGRRERAWMLAARRQLADREAINGLWQQFLSLRRQMAENAGFPDYRAFCWQQRLRFDYTPEDCFRFHRAIEEVVVPAAARLYERRRRLLGVKTLRPWDLDVDPLGRPPLRPFQRVEELQQGASAIFHRVDPRLGGYFDLMAREGLLDLANRKNKGPGAFCTAFPASRRPFIFQNAVGLHDDVQTLLHESGHAFHLFERLHLPYFQQRQVGAEFNEVASMAMEFLAMPYLAAEAGGFYSPAEAARARIEHLEKSLLFWPYMAVVDAFQHWVYENPDRAMEPHHCDAQWAALWNRFMVGVDWSGLEEVMMTGWQRKHHIHLWPFYYVEYGLAQLGAVQIWGNALSDQSGAVTSYCRALALGGTVPLPRLYETAGARLAFDSETLGRAVRLMEETIRSLEEA